MAHDVLDDELLALQLQLEDLADFSDHLDPKGKRPANCTSDIAIALQDYRQQIEEARIKVNDTKLARSLACAIQSDANVLRQHVQDQARAASDRQLATRLAGGHASTGEPSTGFRIQSPAVSASSSSSTSSSSSSVSTASSSIALSSASSISLKPSATKDGSSTRGFFGRLSQLVGINNSSPVGEGQASTSAANSQDRSSKDATKTPQCASVAASGTAESLSGRSCVCCNDEEQCPTMLIGVPCGDLYCINCLRDLFVHASKDESLFPPRCCREPIALDVVRPFMSAEELSRFERASIEFSTSDRIYCAQCTCGTFILPIHVIAGSATCQECHHTTCAICKQPGHEGDCPEDTTIQETLALAASNEWRRCSNCKRMVELNLGCNHIT